MESFDISRQVFNFHKQFVLAKNLCLNNKQESSSLRDLNSHTYRQADILFLVYITAHEIYIVS